MLEIERFNFTQLMSMIVYYIVLTADSDIRFSSTRLDFAAIRSLFLENIRNQKSLSRTAINFHTFDHFYCVLGREIS